MHMWRRSTMEQVVDRKYGEEEVGWCSCEVRVGYEVGLWKAIKKGLNFFNGRASFVVDNEKRGEVWKDRWGGNRPFFFLSLIACDSLDKGGLGVGLWN